MALHESGEDYLEAILVLRQEHGIVRSIDVAQHLGFSKPSVMVDMPKRKVAMAPMRVITSVIFTCLPPNLTSLSNCVRGGRNDAPGTEIERIASLPQHKLYPCFP